MAEQASRRKGGLKRKFFSKTHFSSNETADEIRKGLGSHIAIKLVKGQDLLASDVFTGSSDPVCFFWCGNPASFPGLEDKDSFVLSSVQKQTISPEWNETINVSLESSDLSVLVSYEDIDDNNNVTYDELGYIEIPLADVMKNGRVMQNGIYMTVKWFELKKVPSMIKVCGELRLSLGIVLYSEESADATIDLTRFKSTLNGFEIKSNQLSSSAEPKTSDVNGTPKDNNEESLEVEPVVETISDSALNIDEVALPSPVQTAKDQTPSRSEEMTTVSKSNPRQATFQLQTELLTVLERLSSKSTQNEATAELWQVITRCAMASELIVCAKQLKKSIPSLSSSAASLAVDFFPLITYQSLAMNLAPDDYNQITDTILQSLAGVIHGQHANFIRAKIPAVFSNVVKCIPVDQSFDDTFDQVEHTLSSFMGEQSATVKEIACECLGQVIFPEYAFLPVVISQKLAPGDKPKKNYLDGKLDVTSVLKDNGEDQVRLDKMIWVIFAAKKETVIVLNDTSQADILTREIGINQRLESWSAQFPAEERVIFFSSRLARLCEEYERNGRLVSISSKLGSMIITARSSPAHWVFGPAISVLSCIRMMMTSVGMTIPTNIHPLTEIIQKFVQLSLSVISAATDRKLFKNRVAACELISMVLSFAIAVENSHQTVNHQLLSFFRRITAENGDSSSVSSELQSVLSRAKIDSFLPVRNECKQACQLLNQIRDLVIQHSSNLSNNDDSPHPLGGGDELIPADSQLQTPKKTSRLRRLMNHVNDNNGMSEKQEERKDERSDMQVATRKINELQTTITELSNMYTKLVNQSKRDTELLASKIDSLEQICKKTAEDRKTTTEAGMSSNGWSWKDKAARGDMNGSIEDVISHGNEEQLIELLKNTSPCPQALNSATRSQLYQEISRIMASGHCNYHDEDGGMVLFNWTMELVKTRQYRLLSRNLRQDLAYGLYKMSSIPTSFGVKAAGLNHFFQSTLA